MSSSLIDIADWIDRFGMELLDADVALEPGSGTASATAGSEALSLLGLTPAGASQRSLTRGSSRLLPVVVDAESRQERVPELLH